MKLLYKANDINEAHIVAGYLRANGVEAYVSGHYLQGGIGFLAAMDFAHVHVNDDDLDEGMALIVEYQSNSDPE